MSGIFITFEGVDGCGKSTQALIFAHWLKRQGYNVVTTREPGGTPLAEKIRSVLLEPSDEEVASLTELLLYASARAQHVAEKIKPALRDGAVVVCERFTDSTVAYQGFGLGYDLDLVQRLNRMATDGLTPDWTVFMDIDPDRAYSRVTRRQAGEDRIEARGIAFQHRVHDGYRWMMTQEPLRITGISADAKSIRELQREIRQEFNRRFHNR